jgi:hypothetical protein
MNVSFASMKPKFSFVILGSLFLSVLVVSYLLPFFYPFLTPYCWILIPVVANFLVGYLTEEVDTAVKVIFAVFLLQTFVVAGLLNIPIIYDAYLNWCGASPCPISAMRLRDAMPHLMLIIPGYFVMHMTLGIGVACVGRTVREQKLKL